MRCCGGDGVVINPSAVDWFRREFRTYQSLRRPFLPELLGFSDDGEVPALALEDLSGAQWPPPD